ncbi:hypothetical protein DFJ73DRAFT_632647, partial [Zopfochytrium polystomum]
NGKRVLMLPLVLSCDDTSGNESLQWNKYESWIMTFAGLPARLRYLLCFTFFILSSKTASGIETAEVIAENFCEMRDGIDGYDPINNEAVIFTASILQIVADNPMHATLSSLTLE